MTKEEWIKEVVKEQIAMVNFKLREADRTGVYCSGKKPHVDLGFHFTEFEELLIRVASKKAERFMKSYGPQDKGYEIDCSHFINSGNKKI